MSNAVTLRLTPQQLDSWSEALDRGHPGALLSRDELVDLVHDAIAARQLLRLIDTPELVDFPRAVHMEAVHQVQRWGTEDRANKTPAEYYWLLSHLATRALEHHKVAERLQRAVDRFGPGAGTVATVLNEEVAHHREKAAHHTITAAAVLSHWHAKMLGHDTAFQPGSPEAAATAGSIGAPL
jgi:hypothetical protein